MATATSTEHPQWARNVLLTSKDDKSNFPMPEKSLDIASGFNGAKIRDRHPGIFIGVYARYDCILEQLWIAVYKWEIKEDTGNTQWMEFSKYMASQYLA
jgi:hypothetical protein